MTVIEQMKYRSKEEATAYAAGVMALTDIVLDYAQRSVEVSEPLELVEDDVLYYEVTAAWDDDDEEEDEDEGELGFDEEDIPEF